MVQSVTVHHNMISLGAYLGWKLNKTSSSENNKEKYMSCTALVIICNFISWYMIDSNCLNNLKYYMVQLQHGFMIFTFLILWCYLCTANSHHTGVKEDWKAIKMFFSKFWYTWYRSQKWKFLTKDLYINKRKHGSIKNYTIWGDLEPITLTK